MARKLSDLTQATTLSADDLFYLVNNPSGTKDDRSLSAATLFAGVTGNLAAAGPDPWFDVTNPAYGAFNDGSNANATTAGISAAIAAANAYSQVFARGAIVWFPPGWYTVNATLTTPGPGLCLTGAPSQGIALQAMASTIKFTNTGAPLFDLGNDATNNVIFQWLDFEGSNASNILQRGIIATRCSGLTIEHCAFDQLGGQGVKIDGGADCTVRWCTFENCLKVYPNTSTSPGSYVGALQLGSIENIVEYNNINGTAGVAAGGAGSGFMCAAYFSAVENTMRFNTFAFAERGVRIDAGFLNVVVNNRFEYNQREGLVSLGYESVYIANRFGNNSMSANSGAVDCQIGDSGTNGYGNVFADNIGFYADLSSIGYSTNKPSYNFFLNGGGGADANHHNEVYNNRGTNANVAVYAPVTSTAPIALSPLNIEVTSGVNTGTNATIDSQGGSIWKITVLTNVSGASNFTLNAPLNPIKGMRSTLKVVNSSGGALTANLSVLKISGYTDPANGFFKTAQFYYDGTNWLQVGAWSGDMS